MDNLYKYKHNGSDTYSRSLYASISEIIKDSISYTQIEDNNTRKKIIPPVIFSGTGSKSFLQYYFSDNNYTVCEEDVKIEGSYDVIPRVTIKKEGLNILSNNVTSPYGFGELFKVDDDGNLKMYSGTIQGIPLKTDFALEILCNSLSEQDKIWENLVRGLYWQRRGAFIYDGVLCTLSIAFPDNTEKNKLFEFRSLDATENFIIKCNIEVECYLPIVTNLSFSGNKIRKFITTIRPDEVEEDVTELEYTTTLTGLVTNLSDDSPYLGDLILKNLNGSEHFIMQTKSDDGYFHWENIPSKMGYMITDLDGNIFKKGIHLLPNENRSILIELE